MRCALPVLLLALSGLALSVLPGEAARLRVIDTAPNDVLNIRKFPSTAAPIIGIIPPDGHGIEHDGEMHENWIFVRYRGQEGWVSRRFVAPDAPYR